MPSLPARPSLLHLVYSVHISNHVHVPSKLIAELFLGPTERYTCIRHDLENQHMFCAHKHLHVLCMHHALLSLQEYYV